jgi:hypothetical protein
MSTVRIVAALVMMGTGFVQVLLALQMNGERASLYVVGGTIVGVMGFIVLVGLLSMTDKAPVVAAIIQIVRAETGKLSPEMVFARIQNNFPQVNVTYEEFTRMISELVAQGKLRFDAEGKLNAADKPGARQEGQRNP